MIPIKISVFPPTGGKVPDLNCETQALKAFCSCTAGYIQRDGTDPVEQQLFKQLSSGETRIGYGKIKTIGNRHIQIHVIYYTESILVKSFFITWPVLHNCLMSSNNYIFHRLLLSEWLQCLSVLNVKLLQ